MEQSPEPLPDDVILSTLEIATLSSTYSEIGLEEEQATTLAYLELQKVAGEKFDGSMAREYEELRRALELLLRDKPE